MIFKRLLCVMASAAIAGAMLTSCGTPENTVHSIDDLKGKTIGVQIGTTGDTLAGDIEDGKVEKYNKYSDAVQALKQGKVDAVIIDKDTADVFVDKNKDIELLDEGFADESYAIAINLDNTELQNKINAALADLDNEGTLKAIKDYYDSENGGDRYKSPDGVDRSNGKLIMATNAEFPPYESREGDEFVGIDIDMMNAVCDKLGYELQIDDMAFDSVIPAVQSGKADVGVAGLSVTEDRKKNVLFSNEYTVTHLVVMVRK